MSITPDIEVEEGFDPSAEIAREACRDELGDFFSQEDEEFHASAKEAANGRPLKRSWETWTEFRARRDAFKSVRAPKNYFMDADSAHQSLSRLRGKDVLTESDANELHALEDLLDIKPTDIDALYLKREWKDKDSKQSATLYHKRISKQQADDSSLVAFEAIQKKAAWIDRVEVVRKETDRGALELVILRDGREEVRQAAEQRVIELEIAGK